MDRRQELLELLNGCRNALERFVFYKMGNRADGEDVLQEVYLAAFQKLDTLNDQHKFKPWILSIARNKVRDAYRAKAKAPVQPLEESMGEELLFTRAGMTVREAVEETLFSLADKETEILHLYYMEQKPQKEIAEALRLPLGTVKSRLHTAKQSFKSKYPYPPIWKGESPVSKFPEMMPAVKITASDKPVFDVVWEELMGWFIIPKLGETCSWAMYDYPQRTRSESLDLAVVGKAAVHGIEGVEIYAVENNPDGLVAISAAAKADRAFVAQLTDTHSRILLESHNENGVKRTQTFLDEEFIENWGCGKDNCGNETHIRQKGLIQKDGNKLTAQGTDMLDVVDRYEVTLGSKTYDTILVVYIESSNNGIMTETYLDRHGRTVLWRRFNKEDWNIRRYGQRWGERLPQNERVTINAETYVHWYDCITDYIL